MGFLALLIENMNFSRKGAKTQRREGTKKNKGNLAFCPTPYSPLPTFYLKRPDRKILIINHNPNKLAAAKRTLLKKDS
jgi:hypothetical protein